MTTQILVGHTINVLRTLEAESVHCVITSPPYYGLRAYGTEPQVWGGKEDCAHVWSPVGRTRKGRASKLGTTSQFKMRSVVSAQTAGANADLGDKCEHCLAWRGEHGQEPTFDLWLQHEVLIFREIRRVLRKDGCCWVNIGDAYATTPNGRSAEDQKAAGTDDRTFRNKPNSTIGGIFKQKDRLMMPHRLAIALHGDGWWLRDEIVWSKTNPMPSSIKDRTCPAHEFMFMLTKRAHYYYDHVAIQEEFADDRRGADYKEPDGWDARTGEGGHGSVHKLGRSKGRKASERNRGGRDDGFTKPNGIDPSANGGKLKRSVWTLANEPFPEAHFATFPQALIRPAIEASTSARGCCVKCGAQWERITRAKFTPQLDAPNSSVREPGQTAPEARWNTGHGSERGTVEHTTLGWYPSCKCLKQPALPEYPARPKASEKDTAKSRKAMQQWEWSCTAVDAERTVLCEKMAGIKTIPATVLDPFGGSGTTGLVADTLGRDAILIELNPDYAQMARKRIRENLGRVQSDMPEDRPTDLPLFAAE